MNLSRQVQQFIYEDTGHLADGNPINQKIIDFMEYLPITVVPPPPGGLSDKGDNSISSSSSSNIDSIKTSKKNQKEISGIIDLLEVIASQGISGKGKAKQFLDCEDKMIMNSKHEHFADIPKDITLETMAEWRYKYTSNISVVHWWREHSWHEGHCRSIETFSDQIDKKIDLLPSSKNLNI